MTPTTAAESKALPLWASHESAGARPMPVCGWTVPMHYGDPEAEYRAARGSVAVMDASFLSVVEATGKDVPDYLNRRLSQRVIAMEPGDVLRANLLTAEARMLADMDVVAGEGSWMLHSPPALPGSHLVTLLDMYVFTEKAAFADRGSEWVTFGVFGPKGAALLGAVPPSGKLVPVPDLGPGVHAFASSYLAGGIAVVVPSSRALAAWDRLLAGARGLGGGPLGFLAFDTVRVEAGNAWWGIDLGEKSIPLEADLTAAIHPNKGCYPGQETIAKIVNLGHPARKFVGVQFDSDDPPAPDSPLLGADGREIGRLTSSTYSPRLGKAIGLGMVKWPSREAGTPLVGPGGVNGRVVSLPFA